MDLGEQIVAEVAKRVRQDLPQPLSAEDIERMIHRVLDGAVSGHKPGGFYSAADVAKLLGNMSVTQVWRLAKAGKLVNKHGTFPFPDPVWISEGRRGFYVPAVDALVHDIAIASGAVQEVANG